MESPPVSPRSTRSKKMTSKVIEKAVKSAEDKQVSEVEATGNGEVTNKDSSDCGHDTQEVHGKTVSRSSVTGITASYAGETERKVNKGDISESAMRTVAPLLSLSEIIEIELENMFQNEFCKTPVPGFGTEDRVVYSDSDYLALSPELRPTTSHPSQIPTLTIDPTMLSSMQSPSARFYQQRPTRAEADMEFYFSSTDCQSHPKPIDLFHGEEVAYADVLALDVSERRVLPTPANRQLMRTQGFVGPKSRTQVPSRMQPNPYQSPYSSQVPTVRPSPLSQVQNAGPQEGLSSDVNKLVEKEVARRLAALRVDPTPPKPKKQKRRAPVVEDEDEDDKEYTPKRARKQRKC
jgi:hypothetical protein